MEFSLHIFDTQSMTTAVDTDPISVTFGADTVIAFDTDTGSDWVTVAIEQYDISVDIVNKIKETATNSGIKIISADGIVDGDTLGDAAYVFTSDSGVLQVEIADGQIITIISDQTDGRARVYYITDELKEQFKPLFEDGTIFLDESAA